MKEISQCVVQQEERLDAEFFLGYEKREGLLFKDIAKKIIAGCTPRQIKKERKGTNFYTVEDIKKFEINTPSRKVSKKQQSKAVSIQKKDILLTIKGRIGDAAVVEDEKGYINQNIAKITLKEDYDPYTTAAVINSEKFRKNINRIATNQQNPYIRITQLRNIAMQYPGKKMEEKVVKKIKELIKIKKEKVKILNKINKVFSKKKGEIEYPLDISFKNVEEKKRLDAEYFLSPKTDKWDKISLKDMQCIVKVGSYTAKYSKTGAPYVKGQSIKENNIARPEVKITKEKKYLLEKNDILLLRVGSIGKCAMVTVKEKNFIASDNFLILRNSQNQVNTETLFAFFLSEKGKEALIRSSQGSKQPRLNKKTIENLKIPKPTEQVQKKIKHEIQAIQKAEERKQQLEGEIEKCMNEKVH